MQPSEKKIWFPAKRTGWGWGPPTCWQGWAVIILFYLLLAGAALLLLPRHPALFILCSFLLCIPAIAICYLKGEKPRWRSGKAKE